MFKCKLVPFKVAVKRVKKSLFMGMEVFLMLSCVFISMWGLMVGIIDLIGAPNTVPFELMVVGRVVYCGWAVVGGVWWLKAMFCDGGE